MSSATYDLRPDGVSANDSWTNQAGSGVAADIVAAIDDPVDAHNGGTDYITVNTSAAARAIELTLTEFAPAARSVRSVRLMVYATSTNAAQTCTLTPFWRIGGVRYNGNPVTRAVSGEAYVLAIDHTWDVRPDSGTDWTKAALDGLVLGLEQSIDASWFWRPTSVIVRVEYVEASEDLERVRDVASRWLDRWRRPTDLVTVQVPMARGLLAEPMSRIELEHWAPRDSGGQPFGPLDWQRGQFVVQDRTLNPDGTWTLTLEPWRPRALLLHDGLASRRTPSGMENGVPRIMRGNTRTFTRSSQAWCPDPVSSQITERAIDVPQIAQGPWLLIEGARTNALLDSSNTRGVAAAAGWTVTSVSDASADLFEAGSSRLAFRFDAPTDKLEQTTGALSRHLAFSLDHYSTDGQPLRFALRRGSDSKWWRASDGTWVVAEETNAAAVASAWTRQHWHVDLESTTTVFVRISGPTAGEALLGHAQIEAGSSLLFPSSRIVTTSTTRTREADRLLYAWTLDKTLLSMGANTGTSRGGFSIRCMSHWDAADVTGWKMLVYFPVDANNSLRLGYHSTYGLTLEVVAAGVTYRATKAWTPVAGTAYRVGARWCSSRGEQDLSPYAIQVSLDGVLGTATTRALFSAGSSSGSLEVGSAAAAEHWDGGLREFRTVQYVPTRAELARGLR